MFVYGKRVVIICERICMHARTSVNVRTQAQREQTVCASGAQLVSRSAYRHVGVTDRTSGLTVCL